MPATTTIKPPTLEYKKFNLAEIKMVEATTEDPNGSFEGYGNVIGIWDDVKEKTLPGAFIDGLKELIDDGWIAFGHQWDRPAIAMITEAKEDAHGLWFKAKFHSTPAAQEIRTIMRERASEGKGVKMSIGYQVLDDEMTKDGRLLKKVGVKEISYVNQPANRSSNVTNIKSFDPTAGHSDPDAYDEAAKMALLNEYIDEHISAASLLTGLKFLDHSEALLQATEVYLTRANSIKTLRAKEGRQLSTTNRTRISALRDRIASELEAVDSILSDTAPVLHIDGTDTNPPALMLDGAADLGEPKSNDTIDATKVNSVPEIVIPAEPAIKTITSTEVIDPATQIDSNLVLLVDPDAGDPTYSYPEFSDEYLQSLIDSLRSMGVPIP
jgi:HK97 family phage prohead protease